MNSFLKSILGLNSTNSMEFGSFHDRGVSCNPETIHPGETVHINYQGLLRNSGAKEIFLYYSFDNWSTPANTIPMQLSNDQDSFSAAIPANGSREMNFCFKDPLNNWDNNSGHNWNLHLQQ